MSTELAIIPKVHEAIEAALVGGDLSKLTTQQRVEYFKATCESLGFNPLTKPFEYITLNGKLQLYALKSATEQARRIHGISITSLVKEIDQELVIFTASATDGKGRTDVSTGAVNIKGLQGESRANAIMKAETKAKRRVTLSLAGLGLLDETEIEDIPIEVRTATLAPQALLPETTEKLSVNTAAATESTDSRPQSEQKTKKTIKVTVPTTLAADGSKLTVNPADAREAAQKALAVQQTASPATPIAAEVVTDTPKNAEPMPEPPQDVEDVEFTDETTSTETVPTNEQLTAYYDRAKAITGVLIEKGGLQPSKNLSAGTKIKNYILGRTNAVKLTDLSVEAWDAALEALSGDPVAAVKFVEGK